MFVCDAILAAQANQREETYKEQIKQLTNKLKAVGDRAFHKWITNFIDEFRVCYKY